ncbi:MAG: response regulator transcription factor [Saprospiraceae bacterium]|nr:response regulator transcription factor [Saprospiraceae bacterium]
MALGMLFIHWLEFSYLLNHMEARWAFLWVALLFTGVGAWVAYQMQVEKMKSSLSSVASPDVIATPNNMEPLSPREHEILRAMASGKSNQEIADDHFIALSTVKTHVSRILAKTNARRRTQSIRNAKAAGLL